MNQIPRGNDASLDKGTPPGVTPNVIVLTSGLTGSSILTGLISRAGYWTGDQTFKKEYDTYENQGLINLNLQLIDAAGYTGNYTMEFSPDAMARIAALRSTADDGPFRRFLALCQDRQPWIWKDPRLWLTIRYWKDLLPLGSCRFIVLTRDIKHAWVSCIFRRQIRSFGSLKRYENAIQGSILGFLDENQLSYLHMTYEDLVVSPEREIGRLNTYLGTKLTVDDLAAIYHNPLYRVPRSSVLDYVRACLIYAKNYSKRLDPVEKGSKK